MAFSTSDLRLRRQAEIASAAPVTARSSASSSSPTNVSGRISISHMLLRASRGARRDRAMPQNPGGRRLRHAAFLDEGVHQPTRREARTGHNTRKTHLWRNGARRRRGRVRNNMLLITMIAWQNNMLPAFLISRRP